MLTLMQMAKAAVKSLPGLRSVFAERDRLRRELGRIRPGHFYSPIPNLEEVQQHSDRIFDRSRRELPGVDLNIEGQLATLKHLSEYYADQPFLSDSSQPLRYRYDNENFPHADAILLHCMMRHLKPRRMVEVGSGFSSLAMLDTNELFFDGSIRLALIDPQPHHLHDRLRPEDRDAIELMPQPVQDVALSVFEELEAGDILFVDSSHVAKAGSDVNHIFFEILPRLKAGVAVHFHDMFYPFEYPRSWIEKGRFWNEDYLLRAFLQFNTAFELLIWNEMLARFFPQKLREALPLCMTTSGGNLDWYIGGSLWMRRK